MPRLQPERAHLAGPGTRAASRPHLAQLQRHLTDQQFSTSDCGMQRPACKRSQPTGDGHRRDDGGSRCALVALRPLLKSLPFPLIDTYECWATDYQGAPVALLAATEDPKVMQDIHVGRWQATRISGDHGFVSGALYSAQHPCDTGELRTASACRTTLNARSVSYQGSTRHSSSVCPTATGCASGRLATISPDRQRHSGARSENGLEEDTARELALDYRLAGTAPAAVGALGTSSGAGWNRTHAARRSSWPLSSR